MWTAIYMSKNEEEINRLRSAFRDNAIIASVRKRDEFFEILVPSREVSAAHKIIIDMEI